ncbi:MAG TPA: hypothetical protein VFI48_04455 [Hyphomicrobiaceae bacterium]|nr:hypothetical protein [Hyphomicrobiaceae bacterium]
MSTKASVTNRLDVARIEAPIDTRFPQIHSGGRSLIVEEAGQRGVRVAFRPSSTPCPAGRHHLPAQRCVGSTSPVHGGPSRGTGEIGLRAVTTNLNINFLAKPEARDRIAKGHVIRRLGRLR